MTSDMPCNVFLDTASFGYRPYAVQTTYIMGNRKNPTVFTKTPVFGEYLQWYIQHFYIGTDSRFLTVDRYPEMFIEIGTDIFFRKVSHITERKPCKRTKNEQVTI